MAIQGAFKTSPCVAVCSCCFPEAQTSSARLWCVVSLFASVTENLAFGQQSDKEEKTNGKKNCFQQFNGKISNDKWVSAQADVHVQSQSELGGRGTNENKLGSARQLEIHTLPFSPVTVGPK